MAPAWSEIIRLGKGWGHASEGSCQVPGFGILPVPPAPRRLLTYVLEEEGLNG